MCIYTYIYICICTYVYVCIYIYMYLFDSDKCGFKGCPGTKRDHFLVGNAVESPSPAKPSIASFRKVSKLPQLLHLLDEYLPKVLEKAECVYVRAWSSHVYIARSLATRVGNAAECSRAQRNALAHRISAKG